MCENHYKIEKSKNRKIEKSKRAFTLIEVNLAMLIMAGAVLSLISLFSLGFRESRQAREDLAAAALAERVINPLVIALSDPDLKWSEWTGIGFGKASASGGSGDSYMSGEPESYPSNGGDVGWKAYMNIHQGQGADGYYYVRGNMSSIAQQTYNAIKGLYKTSGDSAVVKCSLLSAPSDSHYLYALVLSRESAKSPVITIAVRCVRATQKNLLMSQPVFATAVHFQGDPNS